MKKYKCAARQFLQAQFDHFDYKEVNVHLYREHILTMKPVAEPLLRYILSFYVISSVLFHCGSNSFQKKLIFF